MTRALIVASIEDALHFTPERRAEIIASYPEYEREARVHGNPTLGSGRIFPIEESKIAIEHRTFPAHWPRVGGLDFGWDHPFAAVELVHDRDADTIYVARTHRIRESTPAIHASALRGWGLDLRWAWPRDGNRETLEGAGTPLAEHYRREGLNMLHEHAQFQDKSISVWAGLQEMLARMESGRFKVFKHLNDWWEEFRLYHHKEGKPVKLGDDLMSATRYAVMMLRYASTKDFSDRWNRPIEYPKDQVYV